MTRDFEKYLPLPWKVKNYCGDSYLAIGKGINKNISFARIAGGGWDRLLDDDQLDRVAAISVQREIARYLVTCANLMPEAVEVINELLPYCMHGQKRVRAERFLAKLEGGGGE